MISFPLSCFYKIGLNREKEMIIIKCFLLRHNRDLFERVKLLAVQEGISINKMFVRLIELGIIIYLKGGMIENENDNK